MKKIILIAGTEETRQVLHQQLNEYLADMANIDSFSIDEGISEELTGDLFVFSSKLVLDDKNGLIINSAAPIVIGKRTINYSNLDKLFFIPENSEVIFVNDVKESTLSCIESLNDLGINHLKYIPYYPGIESFKFCDVAITPGEIDKIPSGVKTIINLGTRPFDMSTLIEVMNKLGIYDERATDVSSRYVKKIIELGKKLSSKNKEVITLNKDLERIIIDINRFKILDSELRDANMQLNNLSEENRAIDKELVKKRFFAKYTFENIIGKSKALTDTIKTAKQLAVTNLGILIEGESGTGKELFASSIHNYSKRKQKSFVAVNFSAFTESLIESELFGYEEGSFTGAKKGGKIGLFEQAMGGTIFLDEIGDAPPFVQTRLLRVLQEKEIMRIGGDRIIPIDVRVIAATNKNLFKLIEQGKFREDLYYRLKMGYLVLPPLRNKKEDIGLICENFAKKRKLKVSPELKQVFCNHCWKGNVRELLNVLEYCFAVSEGEEIKVVHLPRDFSLTSKPQDCSEDIKPEYKFILRQIYDLQLSGVIVGRKSLCQCLILKKMNCTEQSTRTMLDKLEILGLITKGRGKIGTKITEDGIKYLDSV